MWGRWNSIGYQFLCFLVLINNLENQVCWSLNADGLALLEFRARIVSDPFGVFANWDKNDGAPCSWSGVHCLGGKVQILDMRELHLEGTLAPELGKLSDLRSLVLPENHFSGTIPKELGELTKLEVLDLRSNMLSGTVPAEIFGLPTLKHVLLENNKFEGSIPMELNSLTLLSELEFGDHLTSVVAAGIRCENRKFGQYCNWYRSLKQLNKVESFISPIKGVLARCLDVLSMPLFKLGKDSLHTHEDHCSAVLPSTSETHSVHPTQHHVIIARRRLLEQSSNLPAAPAFDVPPTNQIITLPSARSSGTFPAIPSAKKKHLPSPAPQPSPAVATVQENNGANGQTSTTPTSLAPSASRGNIWKYFLIIPGVIALFLIAAAAYFACRTRAMRTISIVPWRTGLSGQLQKAFVTGVPKLNRSELETACEDFSNIIDTFDGRTIYKGTLSSGVEIAVASTSITSSKDWFKTSEMAYRKKIDTLSRINHKNFVNLIGFCEEDEPFIRMMVFEYAPNGTVFERIHVKEMEHLDWNARMRIIMGTAYCLQYMHHDLNPPVAHSNLSSHCIYLTDDYAAKVAEVSFSSQVLSKSSKSSADNEDNSELPALADPETNVYSFGILLLELISGKLSYYEKDGPIEKWAAQYLDDYRNFSSMIDPSLTSFKRNELDVICEVAKECTHPDPKQRPTMKDVVTKLRQVINISPDQAVPRLSPLWWAELEILSAETT